MSKNKIIMANWFGRSGNSEAEPPASPPLELLCAVYSSDPPVEAHIISGMLKASGLGCVLNNEFFAAVDSPVSDVTGGVQVPVRASDVDRVRDLLAEIGGCSVGRKSSSKA